MISRVENVVGAFVAAVFASLAFLPERFHGDVQVAPGGAQASADLVGAFAGGDPDVLALVAVAPFLDQAADVVVPVGVAWASDETHLVRHRSSVNAQEVRLLSLSCIYGRGRD